MSTLEETTLIREYVASLDDSQPYVSERDIAEKFLMNRSNSRKLLMRLEGEGLLECIPQRGYRRVDYSNTTKRTFFTVRCAIESEAARLAVERATREDILRLMLILDEADTVLTTGKLEQFPSLDGDFHRALVNASHDNMLKKLFTFIYIPSASKSGVVEELALDAHHAHQAILAGVRARDPQAALRALQKHIGNLADDSKFEVE